MTPFPLVMQLPMPRNILDWLNVMKELPYLVLLDSARSDTPLGRYSFLAADPFATFKCVDGRLFEDGEHIEGDVFQLLKERLGQFYLETIPHLPPLQGGAIGYLGYGMGRYIESLPTSTHKIAHPDLYMGFYDVVIALDHALGKAYIFSSGYPEKGHAREKRARERMEGIYEMVSHAGSFPEKSLPAISLLSDIPPDEYKCHVETAMEYIRAGDIYQANIAQMFRASLPEDYDLLSLYHRVRLANPAPFSAYLSFGKTHLLSSSPERFLQLKKNRIETRPIKGTRPRFKDQKKDREEANLLRRSTKDRAENLMIVDLLRNDLSKVARLGSVKVPLLCGLESYASVHHLVSVITADLQEGKTAIDLLCASFPGGSITGAPKIRAMEIIHELEESERGPYCGSILWLGFDGAMDSNIIIRTLVSDGLEILLQTGCGIVADSDPEAEYQESLDKARTILKVLAHDMVE